MASGRVAFNIAGLHTSIIAEPLTPTAFGPFGHVVQNPRPDLSVWTPGLPHKAIPANQGTAIKYQHVGGLTDLLEQAPSGKRGSAVMNLFVCAARDLDPPARSGSELGGMPCFRVGILERHPFTSQTFMPLSARSCRYLVVAAPSLPPGPADQHLPVPSEMEGVSARLPGRGLPDLAGLRAFVATSEQAVTYGPGTWHAPMVALGLPGSTIGFVVVQFANGVQVEDCQEVLFEGAGGDISVEIPGERLGMSKMQSKL